ncbi:MAG: cupin domain-containing protein [Actinomycetia bacterium]|nr:cupin domain-containing protein [Actinomycetes bacterium]
MTTRTRTATSHYEVQKKRRSDELEYWRQNRLHLVKGSEVVMHPTPRGIDRGVLVGIDGDRPSVVLDAHRHEIAPGAVSTVHRHSWDAIMFVTSGRGWTEVNGRRYDWRAWDTVFLPAWAWHRHGNEGNTPATYVTFGSEPLAEMVGMAIIEEAGDTGFEELPPPPAVASPGMGSDPYTRRIERLARRQESFSETRIMTAFDDINFRVTPRGARSGFLIDRSIGYRTGGLTAVMHQLAPGLYQSQHRHGGEAWLYCTTGQGYSVIDGERYDWGPGDMAVVDHWAWHQHFNASDTDIAAIIRVHNFDSLYMGMRALLDPLNLFEEPPKLDAPDLKDMEWPPPDAGRPK